MIAGERGGELTVVDDNCIRLVVRPISRWRSLPFERRQRMRWIHRPPTHFLSNSCGAAECKNGRAICILLSTKTMNSPAVNALADPPSVAVDAHLLEYLSIEVSHFPAFPQTQFR